MTKKEAAQFKAAWQAALTEGRVIRYNNGQSMKSFKTREEALKAVEQINTFAGGASIVAIEGANQ
jgi:hypothetical protein